ncbi:uncharacterized protein LOC120977466 [Bufo bufo]|uniref:uncharacterized protein LOC120977466 n=1 Tax=Bufo bufo TaxID=8384 RepID=UPI001ABE2E88|nr:uncharacterized protein LOC120977466 [Bufo bufo]
MDEPRAGVDPIVEEPGSSPLAFAKMTRPVVTCDVHGAKRSKRQEDQSSELIENLHEEGHLHDETSSQDGPVKVKGQEVLNDPYEIDIETLKADLCISNHSMDTCVTIAAENAAAGGHVEPGPSHPIDRVDSLHGLPRSSSGSGQSQVEDDDDDPEKNLEGNETKEPVESSKLLLDHEQEECPICTELYDTTKHKQSLLHCNHVFCDDCIRTMVNTANRTNLCRVTCPICRQTTPMLEWEVHKMQEQMMMESGGVCIEPDYVPAQALVRRPGLCGALEYRFHKRFRSGRLFLLRPCLRNPQGLMTRLNRLEHRCRCLYLFALMFLLFAEFFCFFFLFLPILVFILMILFGK